MICIITFFSFFHSENDVCFLPSKLLVTRLKEAFNSAKLKRDDDLRNTLILTTGEIGRYGIFNYCLPSFVVTESLVRKDIQNSHKKLIEKKTCFGESCSSLSSPVRASQGSLVSFSLLRLLHCLLSKSSPVSVAAYAQIRALATAKGLKLQTLFSQYKNPICQV